jgi:prolyl 4-hydroxylase
MHKTDLASLHSYVRCYDAALTPDFCVQMVNEFERSSHLHATNGRGHHPGIKDSTWVELNLTPIADKAFLGFFHAQIDTYLAEYNKSVPLTLAVPSRPAIDDLRIKRYRVSNDDHFEPHFDAIDIKSHRYLVFLWYLNDVSEGGETEFVDLGIKIQARAGRLLMFPPYWMFQHAGLPPRSNDKYIVSTYLMF